MTVSREAKIALAIAAVAFAAIAGAWGFEWAGYQPCELCLKERLPYYGGVPLALLVAWLAMRGRSSLLPAGFLGLALVFGAGALLGIYHAGVEWQFWPGPASCTGSFIHAQSVTDFRQQLESVHVVRCDAAALRIAGLSLAGWNAVIALTLTIAALIAMNRAVKSA